MAPRSWIPLVAAVIVAAVCVRLGLWQLDRLGQRKVRNAGIAAAFPEVTVTAETAIRDSVTRFRRVRVSGQWDYSRESTVGGRTRSGSPGVHVVTPVTLADGASILVNRGWVYSPDARTIDLARGHARGARRLRGRGSDISSGVECRAALCGCPRRLGSSGDAGGRAPRATGCPRLHR